MFIVGNAGTGKSMVWKSLFKANQIMKKKPMAVDLNPKAVTNNELFGIINPATREWKDGQSSNVDNVDNYYVDVRDFILPHKLKNFLNTDKINLFTYNQFLIHKGFGLQCTVAGLYDL